MTDAAFASFASRLGLSTHFRRGTRGDPVPVDGDEQTVMVANPVSLMYAHGKSMGRGTLTITTRRVVWCSASQPSSALALRYQQIVAHAISRTDALVHQRPCIYLQMDDGEADRPATADTEAEPAELEPEIRLVPEDISKLEDIFKALCECAALNPDEELSGEGDFYYDEDEVLAGADGDAREALLAQRADRMDLGGGGDDEELQELVGVDPGRFDDAEEDGGDGGGVNGSRAGTANGVH